MTRSDTLWDVFRATGYIGAYILYRETLKTGEEQEIPSIACEIKGVAGI